MTGAQILAQNGIKLATEALGKHVTTCPRCSAKRKPAHRKLKVLGVKIDEQGVCWRCNHCGWTGPEKGSGNGYDRDRDVFEAIYDYIGFQKVRYPKGHVP